MEGVHDKSMDLKASAEQEVRKLQDRVKKLERQNELLRYTKNGAFGGVAQKRESLNLEDVTLINLNDSADDLEDSWLYESPVKQATPEQKSVSSSKWAKTVITDGLDDVRKCLIDKLDDIEAQQELSKVRMYQKPESRISTLSKPNDSLFFQPTNRAAVVNRRSSSGQQVNAKQFNSEDNPPESYQLGTSPHGSIEDLDDEPQGPILRRSALTKESDSKSELQRARKTSQSLETRKLTNISPASRRSVSPTPDENLRIQPRSRTPLVVIDAQKTSQRAGGDNNAIERDNFETSSQSSPDNADDDIDDRVPVVRRSALALPKPSSEGLSKQLWYSGPISERQKPKADSSIARIGRSVSPGPGSKLQPRPTTGVAMRSSAGSRGSMEDMLDFDDNAPVQRRSLPQIPTDSNGVRSRLAKSDESMGTRTPLKPRSKAQNLLQPATQGNVVTRRSLLTPPSSASNSPKNSRAVVARRKAPSQTRDANLDDSWKEGCY